MRRAVFFGYLLHPLPVLLGLALCMRFFSFFPSVINHDESTYIVIADGLLRGKMYFQDYVDTKPIGVFMLYAAVLKVLPAVWAIRVFTALWVGVSAWFLYLLSRRLGASSTAAWAAGILYIILCSVFTFYGVSPNTELYYCGFTIAAAWLLTGKPDAGRWMLAGLCLGLGFIVKYSVLFDALAFGLFLLWRQQQQPQAWGVFMGRVGAMAVAMALPFAGVWWYYEQAGLREPFLYYTFEVMRKYPVSRSLWEYARFLADFLLRYLPVSAMFFYAAWARYPPRALKVLALLWAGVTLAPVMITGRLFGHYFIQAMPAFALLAGAFFHKGHPRMAAWLLGKRVLYPLMAVVLLANLYWQKKDYYDRPDYPRQIAAWLKPRLQPDDQVYAGNYHQILYFLLQRDSPAPYVHRSLLWAPHHVQALGIDEAAEWERLIKLAPRFVVLQDGWTNNAFTAFLQERYQVQQTFGKNIHVWERRP